MEHPAGERLSVASFNLNNLCSPGIPVLTNKMELSAEEYEKKIAWTADQLRRMNADIVGVQVGKECEGNAVSLLLPLPLLLLLPLLPLPPPLLLLLLLLFLLLFLLSRSLLSPQCKAIISDGYRQTERESNGNKEVGIEGSGEDRGAPRTRKHISQLSSPLHPYPAPLPSPATSQEVIHEAALRDAVRRSGVYADATVVVAKENGIYPTVGVISRIPVVNTEIFIDFPKKGMLDFDDTVVPITAWTRPVLKVEVELAYGQRLGVFVAHLKSMRPDMRLERGDEHDFLERAVGKARSLVRRSAEALALRVLLLPYLREKVCAEIKK